MSSKYCILTLIQQVTPLPCMLLVGCRPGTLLLQSSVLNADLEVLPIVTSDDQNDAPLARRIEQRFAEARVERSSHPWVLLS